MSKNKKKKKYKVGDVVRFITSPPLTFMFGIITEIDDEHIKIYKVPDIADMFMIPKNEFEESYTIKDFEKLCIKDYGKHVMLFMRNVTMTAKKHLEDLSVINNSYPTTVDMKIITENIYSTKATDIIRNMIKDIDPKYKIYIIIENLPYKVKLKNDKVFIDGNPVVE